MPHLTWDSKTQPALIPANLELDSIIFPQSKGYPDAIPENRLILGDNLTAMSALLPEYEGRINLIYADPPFFTNRRYPARVGRGEDSRHPQGWKLADGYPDDWPGLDAYLDMLYKRLVLMHRLLAPTGTLYLHLDWHANAYARLILDEIFGSDRLLNEIIWVYHGPSPIRTAFNRKHDTILAYTKSRQYTFNVDQVRQPYDPSTVKTFASSIKAGFGKVPDLGRGKVPEDWWYFPVVARLHNERTGYPTQKPEALLERLILASSNPGELVADFFCGSGTSAVVATRLGRRFIANDLTWRSVHTARTRLVSQSAPPFSIEHCIPQQNYEGQATLMNAGDSILCTNQAIALNSSLLSELDYWEVDPSWNGKVFYSQMQALRPPKKDGIAPEISIKSDILTDGDQNIAIRFVKIDGAHVQIVLGKPNIS